jgi:hypothetical protein
MQTQQQQSRVQPGIMYGITHRPDGSPIVREPKLLKVGIGKPKGPAIAVWIDRKGKWKVEVGFDNKSGKAQVTAFDKRADAEQFYRQQKQNAPTCRFPRKNPYFGFTRQVADGTFEPDFAAIEAHGPVPTEIDIVFFDDNPFFGGYQMWSASELQCRGDGINAERVLALASTPEEKELAEDCRAKKLKYFPIIDGCWVSGKCKYAGEACKPGGDLKFQLAKNLRIGGTAYFHTTGFRSSSQLFSCLHRFKCLTGGGVPERGYLVGIPFKMVLRPYKTNHNGQASTQYGASLEFRAETVEALVKNMIEQGMQFRSAQQVPQLTPTAPRQIAAPEVPMIEAAPEEVIDEGEDETMQAKAMASEFYPDAEFEDAETVIDEGDDPGEGASKPQPATGSIALDDLKPSEDPNRGHDAAAPVVEEKAGPKARKGPKAGGSGQSGDYF